MEVSVDLQTFLKNYAMKNEVTTKDAAWEIISKAMHYPEFTTYLPDGFMVIPPVSVHAEAPVRDRTPVARERAARNLNSATTTTKESSGEDTNGKWDFLKGSKPTSLFFEGSDVEVDNWKNLYVKLVELAVSLNPNAVPPKYFLAEPTKDTVEVEGRHLNTFWHIPWFASRINRILSKLDKKMILTYTKAGETLQYHFPV